MASSRRPIDTEVHTVILSGSDAVPMPDGAVAALATALERLVAQVTLHLDPDTSEGVQPEDPAWAATHAEVVALARECAEVLDDPMVIDALLAG